MSEPPVVRVKGLQKQFTTNSGLLGREETTVNAVENVSFEIERGETYALVGESGSGKTTVGKTLLQIHEPTAGRIYFEGDDITGASGERLTDLRREMQMVFQDPTSSLNPRKTVRKTIRQPLDVHSIGSRRDRREKVESIIDRVDLPRKFLTRHPNALSGGQKQRVGIARALVTDPTFLVLDEPTSALDVSVQAKIIDLLDELQNELDLTYLFISHDLSLMQNISDRIGVMYLGELVETGTTNALFSNPVHPYTRGLLRSIPLIDEGSATLAELREEEAPEGEIPDPTDVPSGCSFHTRCPRAEEECYQTDPALEQREDCHENNHEAACHFPVSES